MLPDEWAAGDRPAWGDPVAMERLIRQIAASEGPGKLLGKGVRRAAAQIGEKARRRAPHVKGLELSGYHPGYMMGTALGYAVSSRGGDFNNLYAAMEYSWPAAQGAAVFGSPASVDCRSAEKKGDVIRRAAILSCALDSLGLCKVPALSLVGDFDLENEAKLAGAVTGKPFTAEALLAVGERIVNLERVFNLEHGLDPLRDDCLPEVFYAEGSDSGERPVLTRQTFEKMRAEFYSAMGWDRCGIPRGETLCRLEIPLPAQKDAERKSPTEPATAGRAGKPRNPSPAAGPVVAGAAIRPGRDPVTFDLEPNRTRRLKR